MRKMKSLISCALSLTLALYCTPAFALGDQTGQKAASSDAAFSNVSIAPDSQEADSDSAESESADQTASAGAEAPDASVSSAEKGASAAEEVADADLVAQGGALDDDGQAADASVAAVSGEAIIVENGVYELMAADGASALSIADNAASNGDNALISAYESAGTQKFRLTNEGSGLYSICVVESGQSIDIVASGTASGTNVTQWPYYGGENQKWSLHDNGDGSVSIVSDQSGLVLSAGFGSASSANVCVAEAGDASMQKWTLKAAKTVSSDTVYISATADGSKVLDVCAGSTAEGANVTLWDKTCVKWQRYELRYLDNGYYQIIVEHSGQALDVVASGKTPGTNVTQWGAWGNANQQWDICANADGSYRIVSRCNGLELSCAGTSAGSNVQVGSGSSQWWLASADEPSASRTIADGVYAIGNFFNQNEGLDVVAGSTADGANVTLWSYYGDARQHYQVSYEGNGYYSIKALHSGQSLDIVASSGWPGANVTQWPYCGTDNQLWAIVPASDGSYSIVSKCSGLTLGCAGDVADGTNVCMQTPDGSSGQAWNFTAVPVPFDLEEGVYLIANYDDPSSVLDVVAGSSSDGANVTLWHRENPTWQRFRIMSAGDGYYRIAPLHSGQALDVCASGTASGTNVTQWSYYGGDNQLWRIELNPDGSIRFISKCNGLALAVDGSVQASTNVVVKTPDASSAQQKWQLRKCSTHDSFKVYLDAGHGWSSSNVGEYDPGACSQDLVEAELTDEVVAKVAQICRDQYGLAVHENTYGGLYRYRHSEAVQLACSTFLSFHFNSGGGTGVESYIHSYNAAAGSAAWQQAIHPWLVAGTGLSDRGMKEAELAVCGGRLPSVLMELGFIDSSYDMGVYDADRVARFIAAGINEAASNPSCQA